MASFCIVGEAVCDGRRTGRYINNFHQQVVIQRLGLISRKRQNFKTYSIYQVVIENSMTSSSSQPPNTARPPFVPV